MKRIFPFLFLICQISVLNALGQLKPDSISNGDAANRLRNVYTDHIGESCLLYTGIQYIRNGQKTEGFPFFKSEEPLSGSVYVNGLEYPNLSLQLDLETGQLVTRNFANTSQFVIEPHFIDSFFIDGHHFIALKVVKNGATIRPGYYEYLRAGLLTLYLRLEKKLQSRPDYALSAYQNYDQVFLEKAGIIHSINSKRELLELLADNGKLKKFFRSENLKFSKDPAGAALATFRYYESITR